MRRFRLSTLLLLIVIAALVSALVVQERRAAMDQVRLHQELERMRAQVVLSSAIERRSLRMLEKLKAAGTVPKSVVKSSEPVATKSVDEGDPR